MSLRDFHIIFIVCSAILAGMFAFWSLKTYQSTATMSYLLMAILSGIICVTLGIYGFNFVRTTKAQ